jgi:hypothetical protein
MVRGRPEPKAMKTMSGEPRSRLPETEKWAVGKFVHFFPIFRAAELEAGNWQPRENWARAGSNRESPACEADVLTIASLVGKSWLPAKAFDYEP